MLKIAQVPGRGEPDSDGEINFKHVLATLESLNYQVTEHPEALIQRSALMNPFVCSVLFFRAGLGLSTAQWAGPKMVCSGSTSGVTHSS